MDAGTFIGDGTGYVYIPLDYEPDFVYIVRADTEIQEASVVYGVTIMRDMYGSATYNPAGSSAVSNGGHFYNIEGMYVHAGIYATYVDGTLEVYAIPASRKFGEGVNYNWKAGRFR